MDQIRSLAFRTDLFLVAFDGRVVDRGHYVVVSTPSNPDFWWGNFLLYTEPPDARAAERGHPGSWLDDHDRELPEISVKLFAWDRPDGALGETASFLAQGFEPDESTILTAASADIRRPSRFSSDVVVAPLDSDARWEGAERALTRAFEANRSGSLADLRRFVERQLARYRAMQARGLGRWFGAFVDGEVAGALGVIRDGDVGRFQLVGTDPRHGRRGVCSTLVHDAARLAFDEMKVHTLVMAADASYHAAKVYEAVGFKPTERLHALIRKPPAI